MQILMIILCVFLFVLFFISILGIIKPEKLKDEKTGEVKSRLFFLKLLVFSAFFLIVSLSYFVPAEKNVVQEEVKSSNIVDEINKLYFAKKNGSISDRHSDNNISTENILYDNYDQFKDRYNLLADKLGLFEINNIECSSESTFSTHQSGSYGVNFVVDESNKVKAIWGLTTLYGLNKDTTDIIYHLTSLIFASDSNLDEKESYSIFNKLFQDYKTNLYGKNINVGIYEHNDKVFKLSMQIFDDTIVMTLNISKDINKT